MMALERRGKERRGGEEGGQEVEAAGRKGARGIEGRVRAGLAEEEEREREDGRRGGELAEEVREQEAGGLGGGVGEGPARVVEERRRGSWSLVELCTYVGASLYEDTCA